MDGDVPDGLLVVGDSLDALAGHQVPQLGSVVMTATDELGFV